MEKNILIGLIIFLLFFGCFGQNTDKAEQTLINTKESIVNSSQQENQKAIVIGTDIWSVTAEEKVESSIKGIPQKPLAMRILVDFKNSRYVIYFDDDSGAYLFFDGNYYKITKLIPGKCFVSSKSLSFYKADDTIAPLSFFMFFDILKNQNSEGYQMMISKSLRSRDNNFYDFKIPNSYGNESVSGSAKKIGEHYFGQNITYTYGNGLVYHFSYNDLKEIEKSEFDSVLQKQIDAGKNCTNPTGGKNPHG